MYCVSNFTLANTIDLICLLSSSTGFGDDGQLDYGGDSNTLPTIWCDPHMGIYVIYSGFEVHCEYYTFVNPLVWLVLQYF